MAMLHHNRVTITTMNCSMTVLTLKQSARLLIKNIRLAERQHFLMQSERLFIRLVRRKHTAEDYCPGKGNVRNYH